MRIYTIFGPFGGLSGDRFVTFRRFLGGLLLWSDFGAKSDLKMGGAGGRGRPHGTCKILQELAKACKRIPHARLPLRGAADLRASPTAAGPLAISY